MSAVVSPPSSGLMFIWGLRQLPELTKAMGQLADKLEARNKEEARLREEQKETHKIVNDMLDLTNKMHGHYEAIIETQGRMRRTMDNILNSRKNLRRKAAPYPYRYSSY